MAFTSEAAAQAHDRELEFRNWCQENICGGGEWSADMVARAILERYDVLRKP